jgi:hypothetical protein
MHYSRKIEQGRFALGLCMPLQMGPVGWCVAAPHLYYIHFRRAVTRGENLEFHLGT